MITRAPLEETATGPGAFLSSADMNAPIPAIEWFRSQLSLARAHLDDAIGTTEEAVYLASLAIAGEVCRRVTAELYKALLAPGERTEIERELSSLLSGIRSLEARRSGQQ